MINEKLKQMEGFENALGRFMNNEALYVKFLKKFLEDTTFLQAVKAMEQKDYEALQCHVHTLKGLSSNLGLESLQQKCQDMNLSLRNHEHDHLEQQFQDIQKEYQKAIDLIQEL